MARMIPAVIPEDTQSQAEKKLFPILRESLDDSFTVFHSFDLLTYNRADKLVEGEIDFLIFSPVYGLLVLEVKSGEISYDGTKSAWFQNGMPMPKSPFEQASATKYQLLHFLTSKLGYAPQMTFSHAVCFPDVSEDMRDLPSGADSAICITAKSLPGLAGSITRIMQGFKKSTLVEDRLTADRIRRILMPFFEYGMTLGSRVQQDEQRIISLTGDQCRMLDFIQNHKQALIQGCAGSGKTVMAVKKARDLAAAGNSVLLLAYNRLLGDRLAASVKDVANITASTYHDFCIRHLTRAGRMPVKSEGQSYWEKDIPEAFADLIAQYPLKYDAVIVDEGQDFRVEYWVTIEEMRQPDGYYYIFFDPDQNLWKTDMDLPIKGEPFILADNCRNTRNIFNRLKTYSRREMRLLAGSPDGEEVHQYIGDTDKNCRRYLKTIIENLIEDQGMRLEQIVILGGHSLAKTCLGKDSRLGNYNVSELPDGRPNLIHYHTYMKFKGCESDAVILLDVDENDERWSELALYTAVSRAKHLLYIIWKIQE